MEKNPHPLLLKLILALFILLGFTYAVVTPVFEASDELWHYPMVRHLADGNPLPVQVFDPALAGPWNQEASQPPLYYYLAAGLTFWIDASDMETVRWQNPHVDNGVITQDGNNNLIIHDPALNPWLGTLLAVRVIRFFSVFLGTVTVYLTYQLAKLTIPERVDVQLGATAVLAFTPMFIFISGAVNNDNLIMPLATLALVMMVKLGIGEAHFTIHDSRFTIRKQWSAVGEQRSSLVTYCVLLGLVIGLAALTKISGVGLLPLAWGTLVIYQWKISDRHLSWSALTGWLTRATAWFLLVIAIAFLVAGWWYIRNVQLYGDWRGWSAFIAVLGQRAHPASLRQLWAERWGFMLSYWGLFGGVNVPMPLWIYHILNGVVVTAVVGFPIFVVKKIMKKREERREKRKEKNFSSLSSLFSLVERHFGYVISLLWAGAVVYGIIDWATITWSSQGRLVFSALPSLSILMMSGLIGWLSPKIGHWIAAGLAGFLAVVALLAPFLWIRPSYLPPTYTSLDGTDINVNFNDKIQLTNYQLQLPNHQDTVLPGDTIWLETEWEVLESMERNWSVFAHLNDPVIGQPIAQRDMYLGQGMLATTFLEPGQRLVNRFAVQVPQTAVSPADLDLVIGLYDFNTGERLAAAAGDAVQLETITLKALPGEFPNATAVNFEDELELRGFDISERSVASGDLLELTLYVASQRPLSKNYTFFAQLVDEQTTRWAAADVQPPTPTSSWLPGEVQTATLILPVREETPPAVYPLIIGMYVQNEAGKFVRLQIVTEDGRPTDDFLRLTLVRVE